MIVPPYEAKCYGAVHIDNYLSFIGFCKKVYSDEVCKVDVFLDDERIDSILCDKTVDKIEQIYEIGSHCFKYELDDKYFDKRHMLSFKCDGEELLHSPIETISKDDEKYNEYKFLHSLENTDYEELKDVYKPNSIGFLATRENLEDEEFVGYISQIMDDFKEQDFKAFYFTDSELSYAKKCFDEYVIEYIELDNVERIFENLEVYLSNNDRNTIDTSILMFLRLNSTDVFATGMNLNFKNISIKQHEESNQNYFQKLLDNLEYLGFEKNDLQKYGNLFHEINFKKAIEKYNVDIGFDLNETVKKAYVYYNLKIGYGNHKYFKETIGGTKKSIELFR